MPEPDSKDTQPGTLPDNDKVARERAARHLEEQLDEALADSFPASDPVSFVTSQTEEDWCDEPPAQTDVKPTKGGS